MSKGFLTLAKDGILLYLRVSPGAKRTSVDGPYGACALKLKVASPPVDGKASAEIESFLAGLIGIPSSDVAVIRGATGRDKVVLVRGAQVVTLHQVLTGNLR